MAGKNTAAFGLYKSRSQAESAVDALRQGGFRSDDISVLLPNQQSSEEFAHEKNTKAPEGTTTGVAAGGAIGGTLGLLAGIGALAIPGLGPFIAAGPIMGALAGAGAGGAMGGLVGALVGMGIPEYEAKRYEGSVKDGGILLSVHCDDSEWVGRAKKILEQTGGQGHFLRWRKSRKFTRRGHQHCETHEVAFSRAARLNAGRAASQAIRFRPAMFAPP